MWPSRACLSISVHLSLTREKAQSKAEQLRSKWPSCPAKKSPDTLQESHNRSHYGCTESRAGLYGTVQCWHSVWLSRDSDAAAAAALNSTAQHIDTSDKHTSVCLHTSHCSVIRLESEVAYFDCLEAIKRVVSRPSTGQTTIKLAKANKFKLNYYFFMIDFGTVTFFSVKTRSRFLPVF